MWEKEKHVKRRSKGEGEKTWRREGKHKMRSKVLDRASREVQSSWGEGGGRQGSEGRGSKEIGWSQGRSPTGGFWEQHGQCQVRLPSSSGFLLDRIW